MNHHFGRDSQLTGPSPAQPMPSGPPNANFLSQSQLSLPVSSTGSVTTRNSEVSRSSEELLQAWSRYQLTFEVPGPAGPSASTNMSLVSLAGPSRPVNVNFLPQLTLPVTSIGGQITGANNNVEPRSSLKPYLRSRHLFQKEFGFSATRRPCEEELGMAGSSSYPSQLLQQGFGMVGSYPHGFPPGFSMFGAYPTQAFQQGLANSNYFPRLTMPRTKRKLAFSDGPVVPAKRAEVDPGEVITLDSSDEDDSGSCKEADNENASVSDSSPEDVDLDSNAKERHVISGLAEQPDLELAKTVINQMYRRQPVPMELSKPDSPLGILEEEVDDNVKVEDMMSSTVAVTTLPKPGEEEKQSNLFNICPTEGFNQLKVERRPILFSHEKNCYENLESSKKVLLEMFKKNKMFDVKNENGVHSFLPVVINQYLDPYRTNFVKNSKLMIIGSNNHASLLKNQLQNLLMGIPVDNIITMPASKLRENRSSFFDNMRRDNVKFFLYLWDCMDEEYGICKLSEDVRLLAEYTKRTSTNIEVYLCRDAEYKGIYVPSVVLSLAGVTGVDIRPLLIDNNLAVRNVVKHTARMFGMLSRIDLNKLD